MARRSKFQRGSITKRGKRNKVWVARWWEDEIGVNGQLSRIRKSEILGSVREIPTRREAEQALATRLCQINDGDYRRGSRLTLRQFVELNWKPMVFPTIKYSTKKHYEYVLKVHLLPVFGNMQLSQISVSAVQGFLTTKLRSGLSWKTVKHLRTLLGALLAEAEFQGLTTSNPVRRTRLPRREPSAERASIAPEEIGKLLEALAEPSRSLGWLLVLTGLRVGELLALRWRDVDLGTGVLRVRQSVYDGHFDEPKTQRSKRTLPLAAKAVEIFQRLRPEVLDSEALIFHTSGGSPLSRRNLLRRQLAPAAKKLGMVGVNWHWLRHANATLLDAVGTPLGTVQALLGHSSAEVTRAVYMHSVPADARQAVEKVGNLLIGPNWTQVSEVPENGSRLIQ